MLLRSSIVCYNKAKSHVFRVLFALAIRRGGTQSRTVDLQSNALPLSYTPFDAGSIEY